MRAFKTVFLLLSLFPLFTSANEKDTAVKYLKFESLTINDGLSQGMINCILQDHYGFMWFATKDGLNRFDGYRFVIYKHNPSDSTSVADNFIQTIFEDSKGRLWIGTASKGLDLFDRNKETFIHHVHDDHNPNSLSDNHVMAVTEDVQGILWVTTLNQLDQLKINDRSDDPARHYVFSLADAHRNYVYASPHGNIYFSKPGELSVQRLSDKGMEKESVNLQVVNPNYNPQLSNRSVNVILEDSADQDIFYVFQDCISRVHTPTGKTDILSDKKFHRGMFNPSAILNHTGMMWLVDFDWLLQFDLASKKMIRILSDNPLHEKMLNNASFVYQDRSGIIWVGTKGYGILKYNPRSEKFHHTDKESILSLSASLNGKILVCKDGKYLYVYDPASASYVQTLPDEMVIANPAYSSNGILDAGIETEPGIFWICKSRVIHYDDNKKTFTDYLTANEYNFPVFKDRQNVIWCGSDKAFSKYDSTTDSFIEYPYPIKPTNVPYRFLEAMHQDATGIFWLGTTDGLFRFDDKNNSWRQFKNVLNDSLSLSSDVVFSICADPLNPAKYLWIGTNGGGLNRFEIPSGKVNRFSEKNGLANDVVYGILPDDEGNLWMSTNKGISKFDPREERFRNFELRDGLQSNEFNRNAYCKLSDGTLCFGGVNGFNYFNPKDLRDNLVVPQILITDIKISNHSVSFNAKGTPLTTPSYLASKIVLRYRDNMISFEFTSMDFTAPQKNLYQYKLDGFDENWISSGINHTATYTNLNPGEYIFRVKGSNSDEVWNNEGTSMLLTILPPWYMTWWFRLLFLAAIVSGIYFLYRYRLQQLRNLQAVRNRIARDLHDEIGSTLLSISLYSEVAGQVVGEKVPEAKSMLKQISESTTNMMEAMSDIVWTINTRNDRFDNMVNRMRAFAVEILEAKHCSVQFNAGENILSYQPGMEQRKNLYLIFKETINNAAKHSGCKNVRVDFYSSGNFLHLKITDDGKGFIPATPSQGNGLINLRKRAEELNGKLSITSGPGKGTSVELTFKM